ncbi:NAD-dependent protein deacetylase_gp285 [Bacillus phage vB_BceM_WH1]|nr:NAD-dependent protein deacetylase_gp285 [Bacillus phage vB_BceM_WH1]
MEEVKKLIQDAKKITFLTGAGMSTASGIPDFRSSKGLKGKHIPFEKLLSLPYFKSNRAEFWDNLYEILHLDTLHMKEPNIGHKWIADLQKDKKIWVVTQNIDALHQKAGSENVIEVHGNLVGGHCTKCKEIHSIDYSLGALPNCPKDDLLLKPNIVLYGEDVYGMHDGITHAVTSDVVIVMGTSLQVFPFNSLVDNAAMSPTTKTILVNESETEKDRLFDYKLNMNIVDFVKEVTR